MPVDSESRIGEFTELVATAISNIEAPGDRRCGHRQADQRRPPPESPRLTGNA
jgi:hypothetical protein